MHGAALTIGLGLAISLGACGATAVPTGPADQAGGTAAAVASPPPTPAPKGGPPPSFSPCAPAATPLLGLDNSPVQVGPDSWDVFVTSNQWLGPVSGSTVRWYNVWAGTTGDATTIPGVAAVWVDITSLGSDLCSTTTLHGRRVHGSRRQGQLSHHHRQRITRVPEEWYRRGCFQPHNRHVHKLGRGVDATPTNQDEAATSPSKKESDDGCRNNRRGRS